MANEPSESHDGSGSADHDQPFEFGRHPTGTQPFPFNTREYLHLLIVRSRVQNGLFGVQDNYSDSTPLSYWMAA